MKEKYKVVILVFVLGVLCPNLMLVFVDKQQRNKAVTNTAEYSTTSRIAQQTTRAIPVLNEKGQIENIIEEDYLTSVVLCEMPAEFDLEALKAQAVVARTYTLRRMQLGSKHQDAAVCMDPSCCQGYKLADTYLTSGGTREDVEKVRSAVLETMDLVLTYNGELIEATYFSCSGGYTEDALAVWGTDIPYLRATPSPGEEKAARYTDTVTFTIDEFLEKLACELPAGSTQWVSDIRYTAGGGVGSVRLCGKVFEGTDVRKLLGLRSTAFTITVLGNTVTVTTKGFGHRVGMSQYGADAMAADGHTYEEILLHYYQGASLTRYTAND